MLLDFAAQKSLSLSKWLGNEIFPSSHGQVVGQGSQAQEGSEDQAQEQPSSRDLKRREDFGFISRVSLSLGFATC